MKNEKMAAIRSGSLTRVQRLKKEINRLLVKEELMWKQRSRALWLHEGDSNTRYFHNCASHRFRRNRIDSLENDECGICTEEEEIATIFVNYYQNLFTSVELDLIEEVVEPIPCSIMREMNDALCADFTKEEVVAALRSMEPLRAPGPDGLLPIFFQQFWLTIGDEVAEAVLNFLNLGNIPPSINHNYITLIPKVKSPTKVSEFRPISLYKIVYKLVSRVIANRLKDVLPLIISDSPSAFQSDKAIPITYLSHLRLYTI